MNKREFDLNIEKVLENWTVALAIREVIANAIDEQILTDTDEIQIYCDKLNCWHIRDFGRRVKYIHLTQNENEEKLNHPHLIGKFGVGLKDALATFDRHGLSVKIKSKYGVITLGKSSKYGFDDIITLHAYIEEVDDNKFIGTDFIIEGCSESEIDEAKFMFLKFRNLEKLESTQYGDIYVNKNDIPCIFINGIEVAREENFVFSYNITSINSPIKKALNRERTNVGRSAYSERVKSILLKAKNDKVINELTDNLGLYSEGNIKDELKWTDVATYAVKMLNSKKDFIFMTPKEMENISGDINEFIKNSIYS